MLISLISLKASPLILKEEFTSRMTDQEVRDQERMLNQEEQGSILDGDAQREQRRCHWKSLREIHHLEKVLLS